MASKSTSVKVTLKIASFVLRLLLNIVFYVLVVILIMDVSKKAFDFTYQLYGPVSADQGVGKTIKIDIREGDSTMDVANKLELNHAIKNKYAFYLKARLQNLMIMPGRYTVSTSMTYEEILDIITDYSKSEIQLEKPAEDKKK